MQWSLQFSLADGMSFAAECVSLHNYEGLHDGDLTFQPGQPIVAVQILDNGWWRGYHDDREGWFPGSYVQVIITLCILIA